MQTEQRRPSGEGVVDAPRPGRTLGSDIDHLMESLGRRWPGELPRFSDVVATAVVAVAALGFLAMVPDGTAATVALLVAPLFALPFLWRRSFPGRAASVVVLAHAAQVVLISEPAPVNIAAPMAMYAVARWCRRVRVRRAFVVVAGVGSVLAGWVWAAPMGTAYEGTTTIDPALAVLLAVLCFTVAVTAWLLGALVRQREQARAEMRQRTRAVEQGRIQSIRLAAQEERARIAREMHDVVAHSLSVVVVQSDGATYALDRAAESGDPETMAAAITAARGALSTIGQTARESLSDTRRLVAVLRQDESGADYAPTGGVDDLDDLVAPLRDAGLDIHTDVTGRPRPLPRAADLAAYRVVQESLTNVIKHAGEASVWVSLDYLEAALLITVRDDGAGVTTAPDGAGHGLVGMRERVTAVGGSLWAGGAPGGGFVVEARIPYDARTPVDRPRGSAPHPDEEDR